MRRWIGPGRPRPSRRLRPIPVAVRFAGDVVPEGISFPLADTATQIEAARQLLHRACREIDRGGRRADYLAAQAKLFATDVAMAATGTALQVLGAYGCVRDEPVERWMREAKLLQIIEGTNQIQRAAIAANL